MEGCPPLVGRAAGLEPYRTDRCMHAERQMPGCHSSRKPPSAAARSRCTWSVRLGIRTVLRHVAACSR